MPVADTDGSRPPSFPLELPSDVRAPPAAWGPQSPTVAEPPGPEAEGPDRLPAQAPEFRIVRPHARGGLGFVSVALDAGLEREVALKQIRPELADLPQSRRRFVHEARITGQLEHPQIVPVHALCRDADGRPYYVMKLVHGRTLEEAIADYHAAPDPVAFRALLGRFASVCHAIAYAHSRGVIHRDLKPANIMVGEYGETLILDWGLAKRIGRGPPEAEGHAGPPSEAPGAGADRPPPPTVAPTLEGQVMGTPAYMAPEQAAGHVAEVGPPADVYGLGAVLYQLLTGRPPGGGGHDGNGPAGRRARTPRPARRRRPPRALEAVCLKALAARPADRYTAAELADDVERYLADEPVRAYREPLPARAGRWARHHKPAVAALAVLLLSAVVALAISNVLIDQEKTRTQVARNEAVSNAIRAGEQAALARKEKAAAEHALADSLVAQGDALGAAGRWEEAKARYTDARALLLRLELPTDGADLGLWSTWPAAPPPLVALPGPVASAGIAAYSADGRRALVAGDDRALRLYDLASARLLATLSGHAADVRAVAFSPDGARAASGDWEGQVKLWDPSAGRLTGAIDSAHRGVVYALRFAPDGRTLVSAGKDGAVRLWDPATARPLRDLRGKQADADDGTPGRGAVQELAFSANGRLLLAGSLWGTLTAWDLSAPPPVAGPAAAPPREWLAHHDVTCVAVPPFPAGRTDLVLSGSRDSTLKLWTVATGAEVRAFPLHPRPIIAATFSADGATVVSATTDGVVRLWETSTTRPLRTVVLERGRSLTVRLSPDGRTALRAGADGRMTLWPLVEPLEVRTFGTHPKGANAVALSPDGRLAASGGADRVVVVWDVTTGRALRTLRTQGGSVQDVAFSPDGRLVAAAGGDSAVRLWDLERGGGYRTFDGRGRAVTGIAFSPDGGLLLACTLDGIVTLWDVAGAHPARALGRHAYSARGAAFSPDGRTAYTGSGSPESRIRAWAVPGDLVPVPPATRPAPSPARPPAFGKHADRVTCLARTADGRLLASGSRDQTIKLWDAASGAEVRTLASPGSAVSALALSASGRLAVSGGEDGTVRLWDPAAGREVRALEGHDGIVAGVALSSDGGLVLSAGKDGTVRAWDLARLAGYRAFEPRLAAAARRLRDSADDPAALATLGEWQDFRGMWDWAADLLERARAGGADVSSLALARCHWQRGDRDAARREFTRALERREAPALYLRLCLDALDATGK